MIELTIGLAQIVVALGLLAAIAVVPEESPSDDPFFALHTWTLTDAYKNIVPACFMGMIFFSLFVLYRDALPLLIYTVLPTFCLVIYGLYYFTIKRPYRIDVTIFGLDRPKFLKSGILPANIVIVFFIYLALREEECSIMWMSRQPRFGDSVYLLTFVSFGFVIPVLEELVFRGILYAPVMRRIGTWKAIASLTVIEILLHPGVMDVLQICWQLFIWILLFSVYVKSKSLFGPIILHIGFNLGFWEPASIGMLARHLGVGLGIVQKLYIFTSVLALLVINALWLAAFLRKRRSHEPRGNRYVLRKG